MLTVFVGVGGGGVVANDLVPLCRYLWSGLELRVRIGVEEWEGGTGRLRGGVYHEGGEGRHRTLAGKGARELWELLLKFS